MPLSTQPYKGARDFYPEDKRLMDYIFNSIRAVVASYGYEEYDAPLVEPLDLYLAKSGQEIINEQTYSFKDRAGRQLAIRPEMTPSVARMVAARRQSLSYPLRWYSIPNLWRYERPQKGRFREHWQLNVDIFGVKSLQAELELIEIVDRIFKTFKATASMYSIKVNHRELVDNIFIDYLGLSKDQSYNLIKLIDKMAKLERTTFIDLVDSILSPKQKKLGYNERILSIISTQIITNLPKEVQSYSSFKELSNLLTSCHESGITNVKFDLTVMRGFDYYSGIVFELNDNHPDNNRSIMGGGRYDGLVGLFGVEAIPTVGFGLGDATLTNFLKIHNLIFEVKTKTDIYCSVIDNQFREATKIADELRRRGLNVAMDLTGHRLGDQIKTAEKKGIEWVAIIGPKEISNGRYSLRNIQNSTQGSYLLDEMVKTIIQAKNK